MNKYLWLIIPVYVIIACGQWIWVLKFIDVRVDHKIDLKIVAHTIQTPPTSYEEIIAIIHSSIEPAALKTQIQEKDNEYSM